MSTNATKSVFDRVAKKTPIAKKIDAAEAAVMERLHTLSEWSTELERAKTDSELAIEAAMPQKVRDTIRGIRDEFATQEKAAQENLDELKLEIRELALRVGHTVSNENFMAVWRNGSVSWNKDGLDAYAQLHKELLEYRTEGEPSIAITPTHKKK